MEATLEQQQMNAIDKLGRQIRLIGEFAILKSASAVIGVGSTVRFVGETVVSPIVSIGKRIHTLVRSPPQIPKRRIHVYSDEVNIMSWIHHEMNTKVGGNWFTSSCNK